jgi:hypothetical protein
LATLNTEGGKQEKRIKQMAQGCQTGIHQILPVGQFVVFWAEILRKLATLKLKRKNEEKAQ